MSQHFVQQKENQNNYYILTVGTDWDIQLWHYNKCIPLTQAILQLENRCDGNKENCLLDWHYQWVYDDNDILRMNILIFKCVIPFQQEERERKRVTMYCIVCIVFHDNMKNTIIQVVTKRLLNVVTIVQQKETIYS